MGNTKYDVDVGRLGIDITPGGIIEPVGAAWRLRNSEPVRVDDEQVEHSVRTALQWTPFLKDLTFDVVASGGVVTLTGVCPYASLGRMAGTLAWTVPGVQGVVNDIRIVTIPDEESTVSDERGDDPDGYVRAYYPDSAL